MSNTDNIDWGSFTFSYSKTDYNVRCTFKDGKWGEIEVTQDDTITLHMAATCLHYGQEVFEGCKAYMGKDGRIRIFRVRDNAKRLAMSAQGILMQPVPEDLFVEMAKKLIQLNKRWVPPYGSGASLYLRPVEIGITPRVGVNPATEYMIVMFSMPVGPYFKEGIKPTKVQISRDCDRAAPLGTGCWKVGGNYAAGMRATAQAQANGYSAALFLDATEHKYIDECGPANFFMIKDGKYVTPKSKSILPSITNNSIQHIARDMGIEVEVRPIPVEELATAQEVAECGTGAVIAPIKEIYDPGTDTHYHYCPDGNVGPVCKSIYDRLCAIQNGDYPDTHDWITFVE